MSTALKNQPSFKNLLGFATMVDEKGESFHKSKGNAIEFVESADNAGADIIRWMCALQNPENDLQFGYNNAGEVRRRFYLIFWNTYKFYYGLDIHIFLSILLLEYLIIFARIFI